MSAKNVGKFPIKLTYFGAYDFGEFIPAKRDLLSIKRPSYHQQFFIATTFLPKIHNILRFRGTRGGLEAYTAIMEAFGRVAEKFSTMRINITLNGSFR
jgi:hypothetical protein